MAEDTNLRIRPGLPYSRSATLVGGKAAWPDLSAVEARGQVRLRRESSAPLLADLTPFLALSHVGDDLVVTLTMTGAQTLVAFARRGYYDVLVTDAGTSDAKGVPLLSGRVLPRAVVTTQS